MLTATHTHAGPAHYFDGVFLGDLMSSRLPGYDDRMTNFLADRIARAVHQAWAGRVPAAVAWGHTEEWELTRNRSVVPYLANRPRFAPLPPDDLHLPEQQRAIDPALDVLRIDAIDRAHPGTSIHPIGAITFFAVHPTVLPNTNRMYGADLDGVVSRALEREMRRLGQLPGLDPLGAFVATNEGDISPVWSRGTVDEAAEIGGKLARHVWQAYDDAGRRLKHRVILDERYLEVDLPRARFLDGVRHLCAEAEVGQSEAGGASDHPTSLGWIDAFREGNADWTRADPCERPRPQLVAPVQRAFRGQYSFPSRVPLALVQVDDTFLSFLPAEITVTAGARIREEALAVQVGTHQATHSIIAGLANGYLLYVTTPEEFRLQHYEGASDIYGPETAPFFGERMALLARSMDGVDVTPLLPPSPRLGEATAIAYKTGPNRDRLAVPQDYVGFEAIVASRAPIGLCTMDHPSFEAPSFCFWWGDGGPGRVSLTEAPWLIVARESDPRSPVRVCGDSLFAMGPPFETKTCDPGATVDDRGLDFQTLVHDRFGDAYVWSTIFHPARSEWNDLRIAGRLRIVARDARGGRDVASPPFSGAAMPPPCSPNAARFCGAK